MKLAIFTGACVLAVALAATSPILATSGAIAAAVSVLAVVA